MKLKQILKSYNAGRCARGRYQRKEVDQPGPISNKTVAVAEACENLLVLPRRVVVAGISSVGPTVPDLLLFTVVSEPVVCVFEADVVAAVVVPGVGVGVRVNMR